MRGLVITFGAVALVGAVFAIGQGLGVRDDLDALDTRLARIEGGLADLSAQAVERAADRPRDPALTSGGSRLPPLSPDLGARLARIEAALDQIQARADEDIAALVSEPETAPTPPAAMASTDAEKPDPEKIERWIRALSDDNDEVVFTGTIELANMRAIKAVPDLLLVFQNHDDFYARLGAGTALGELRAADAVPALIDALLDDQDELVRIAAAEAVHKITGKDFGRVSGADAAERLRIHDRAQDWWKRNEHGVRQRIERERSKGR